MLGFFRETRMPFVDMTRAASISPNAYPDGMDAISIRKT